MKEVNTAYFNWSGGKDSALALYHVRRQNDVDVQLLVTTVNSAFQRISMHGVRVELLQRQSESIGIPLKKIELPEMPSMSDYDSIMRQSVLSLVDAGFKHTIFGDIFLEDLKKYREQQLQPLRIQAHFPLWKRDTKELLREFIDLGFKTILVCIKSEQLDESFAGRVIDNDFIKDLPEGVDACGENGEFHTFVYDGPIFSTPVKFKVGEKVYREYQAPEKDDDICFSTRKSPNMGFWFCDLIPE